MSIKDELYDFRDRYHEYTAAREALRNIEEKYASLVAVSADKYWINSKDEVVVEARKVESARAQKRKDAEDAVRKARDAIATAQSEKSAELVYSGNKQMLDREQKDSLERINQDCSKRLDELEYAYDHASDILNPRQRREWVLHVVAWLVALVLLLGAAAAIVVVGRNAQGGDAGALNGPIALGWLALIVFVMILLRDKFEGCGGLILNYFASALITMPYLILGYGMKDSPFAALVLSLPLLIIGGFGLWKTFGTFRASWNARRNARREASQAREVVRQYANKKAAIESECEYQKRRVQELHDKAVAQAKAESEHEFEAKLEVLTTTLDARQDILHEFDAYEGRNIKPAIRQARNRAGILQQLEVEEAALELEAKANAAANTYEELQSMVSASGNLPQEEDWGLIDALCDAVRRGYADTLKEALNFCRTESRYAALIANLGQVHQDLVDFRTTTANHLSDIKSQNEERGKQIEQQIALLEQQLKTGQQLADNSTLAVAQGAEVLRQGNTIISQGEAAAKQRLSLMKQNDTLISQNERLAQQAARIARSNDAIQMLSAVQMVQLGAIRRRLK